MSERVEALIASGQRTSLGMSTPWRTRDAIVRDLHGLPPLLETNGPFEIRLAVTEREIRKIQRLRYKVFYEEGEASLPPEAMATRRDRCTFDHVCDHLYILDTEARSSSGLRKSKVVGCYRLLRDAVAGSADGFYSAREFALEPLLSRHPDKTFLELGRSCVHAAYRQRRVIDLLWRGLWIYAAHHAVDVVFGCASLPGCTAAEHATAFAYLSRHAIAQDTWRVEPHPDLTIPMVAADSEIIPSRLALAGLPPLVKAYLRAGARFSDGAVADRAFATTDVLAILPLADMDPRYRDHLGADGSSQRRLSA